MAILTEGPLLEPENKGIDEFHVGLGGRLGAAAAEAWGDSPVNQLLGIGEMQRAKGSMPEFGAISSGVPTGPAIDEAVQPAAANIDIIDANDRVKKAGLAPHLKLPDQPDIPPAQLAIMMDRARVRAEHEATIERGPQGFIPSALDVGTSFLVGALDPINIASAFIPVMGELRYGKILASAGESAFGRAAVRTSVGAAQGAVGQAALEPLDWYAHTQDGRDFGMADVLHNIMFGAALGGGLHVAGGTISDVYRSRVGKPLYPYGPGEPLERAPAVAGEAAPAAPAAAAEPPEPRPAPPEPVTEQTYSPSPEVQMIDDLPQRAHEDAMRGAISNLIDGEQVRSGEMLEAAARSDPTIADAFEAYRRDADLSPSEAREAVFDDVHRKLIAAGMDEDAAGYNAAIVAARYATRAERLSGEAGNALQLYRAEGIEVRSGEFGAADGRSFAQRRQLGPDLFAAREADGQQSLPGTERIGNGELAQRGADAPLKPGVAQKPLDVGLFGDDAAQKSFFQSRPVFVHEAEGRHGRTIYEVRNASTGAVEDEFATRGEADRFVERAKTSSEGNAIHSLDITAELRQAAMEQGFPLFQGGAESPRGRITLADNSAKIDLFKAADRSTFMHESSHLWLDELMRDAEHARAPESLRADRDAVLGWLGVKDASEITAAQHEQWAEGFERYLADGEAPSNVLAKAFETFKQWMLDIYHAVSGLKREVSAEVRGVMDRLLATDREIAARRAELHDAANVVTKHVEAKAARGRAAADPETWSLFEYLASRGGLRPDPELKAIFGNDKGPFVPGFGALVRKGGMPLDEALRSAKDGRYLFDAADVTGAEARLTPRDLLDRLDDENRKRKVYRSDRAPEEKGIDREHEAHQIVSALHDELEAASGQKGIRVDPEIERRVVEIIQKEGEHDVLAAHERAIMEDEERYNAVSEARKGQGEAGAIPGWDVPDDARAAPQRGAAAAADGGPARGAGPGAGRDAGLQSRNAGLGDRAQAPPELRGQAGPAGGLDRDAAWRQLAAATPDFDAPEVIAASKAADAIKAPPTKLDERVSAAEKAEAFAKQMYDMFADRLPEQDRVRLDDLIKRIEDDHEAREIAIVRGGSCLFGVL